MTTETLSSAEALAQQIKKVPHWRVLLQPVTFTQRYPDQSTARDAARKSAVHLRGWDFPHFDNGPQHGGNEPFEGGWESWTNYLDLEAWRIFRTGQFVHYLSLREDSDRRGSPEHNRPFLNMLATVYQLTEIFEFTSRLVASADFEPGVSLAVRLTGMEGRELISGEPLRVMFQDYVCRKSEVCVVRDVSVHEVRTNAAALAISSAIELFAWFGFEPLPSVIADIQAGLLRRG